MKNCPLSEVAYALGFSSRKKIEVSHFAIDSREVIKNSVFFALKGEKTDGHLFLEEVAQRGALAAVVSQEYGGSSFGMELFRVKNVLETLQELAKTAMRRRKEKVVGITGSMGKTTVKEFLATLLSAKYRVAKSPRNYNSQRTLPLNILNLEGEYDFFILEMGMSAKGEIARLTEIAPPYLAILTRIAPAGMEEFRGGLDAIAEAKGEIFSQKGTRLGIVSAQASKFNPVLYGGGVPKWIYGWKGDFLDYREGDFVMEKRGKGVVIQDSPEIVLPFEATHLQENFCAAATGARALGLSWYEIQEKAKELKPVERRFETIERGGVTFIQDCYNANPESVITALRNLPRTGGKRIGVLGAMPDLGEASSHFHKQVGLSAKNHLDHLLCIGEETKHLLKSFEKEGELFETTEGMKKALFSLAKPGDVVLIKGANRFKLWELLEK